MAIARELGAVAQHLGQIDTKLTEIVVQTTKTNGRVNLLEREVAVLQDHDTTHHSEVERLKGRPRTWLYLLSPFIAVVLAEVIKAVHFS
jgi:hypothetical protein